jgi:3-hydroxyisobutyrate dehydrogenase-like beta-hydroxyacid dehydrogenase
MTTRIMDAGFIGLGSMGKAMAANILKAGHRVRVWNRSSGPVQELRELGAEVAENPRSAFQGDACISMLSDDDAVRAVVMNGDFLPKGGSSTIHINMATVSIPFSKEIAQFHRERGIPYVSAPVFGFTAMAVAAKLNILAAGDAAAIERVQPLFDAMGPKTFRLGDDPSRANIVKIAGNFMVICAIETMGEAAAVVRANGMAAADFFDVLIKALFDVPVYSSYAGRIAEKRFEPAAFKLILGLKDVQLALSASRAANVPLPFASVIRDNFLDAIAHGDGNKDWSAIAQVAERRSGLSTAEPRMARDS